jgi:ferredoxin-NADP reductase
MTGQIELTIRVQPEGLITPILRGDLSPGDFIGLSEAKGEFTLTQRADGVSRLFIAGGSGITPFRSMLQDMLHQTAPAPTTLLYYAHDEGEHLFDEEFQRVMDKHPQVRVINIATQSQGRIHADHLIDHCIGLAPQDVFVCGPTGMIQSARGVLQEFGIAMETIHVEHFGPAPLDQDIDFSEGRVFFHRSSKTVETTEEKPQSLLEMAEASGLNPSYGCRRGVCGQCRCTKTSGVIRNTQTGVESETGTETIQLCISAPVGDVTIDL